MKCLFCGKELTPNKYGRPKKYCSDNCRYNADLENKRIKYTGKRQELCITCGKPLPKFKTKYCSEICAKNKKAKISKECVICGKEFKTSRENILTCSKECSKILENKRDRERYKKNNPNAKSIKEILELSQKRKEVKQKEVLERKAKKEAQLKKAREKREREKQKRIDFWFHYSKLHECAECGEMFIADYPTKKYCSKKCARAKRKGSKRYNGITIDKDISLKKLAKRDKNICAICGELVDWNDFTISANGVVICGNKYPSIDHIKPISKGGLHCWSNIQLAHRFCNSLKSDKDR